MFALSVRSLDGRCRRVDLSPDTTIADIRAELEHSCPPFNKVHLIHGTQELHDGDAVQVELQAISTFSPEKALADLELLVLEFERLKLRCRTIGSEVGERMLVATNALIKTQELSPADSRRLLQFLNQELWDDRECSWELAAEVAAPLAITFGRTCGDPSPHVPELMTMLVAGNFGCLFGRAWLAALAGIEIFSRCGDDMPSKLHTRLIKWASCAVNMVRCRVQRDFSDEAYAVACRVLGLLGDGQHKGVLEEVAADSHHFPNATAAAKSALNLIWHRNAKQASCKAVTDDDNDDDDGDTEARKPNDDTILIDCGAETDQHLDMALAQSEHEALLQEQEDLQESILRSKADCPSVASSRRPLQDEVGSIGSDDRLVLLCFNRRPKELCEALLASPLAERLTSGGVEVKPEWAGGRLILADGVTEAAVSEAREPWHLAVHASDEDDVKAALRSMFGRERPRVKASGGRFLVPQGTSLFQQSDSSVAGKTQTLDGPELDSDWTELPIHRTFIHFPTKAASPHQSSASAPAEL